MKLAAPPPNRPGWVTDPRGLSGILDSDLIYLGSIISELGGSFTRLGEEVPGFSLWSPDGTLLFILTGDGLYVAEAPDFKIRLLYTIEQIGGPIRFPAWVG